MLRFPALFVSHGAPTVALERDGFAEALRAFGMAHPDPQAIIVVSAHWEAPAPVRVNAHPRPALIYDFGGFPDELYRLTYSPPGAPEVAREIAGLLAEAGIPQALESARGWDHGVWIPLRLAYPGATVPVVEVSLPVPRTPAELIGLGAALGPLRERGALLVGSGGVVHNLRRLEWGRKEAPVKDWARAFDDWIAERLKARDVPAIASYRAAAPHADLAVPTTEHFDPLFVVLGALADGEAPSTVYAGFHYGTLSMRTVAFAASS